MKKLLPILSLIILTSFAEPLLSCAKSDSASKSTSGANVKQFSAMPAPENLEDDVYICDSKSATKYHYSETCRGLNNCKHTIVKTTLAKAKKSGRTLCGWED